MDLNYLYHRRGVSLLRAQDAICEQSRAAHSAAAARFANRIANIVLATRAAAT